MSGVDSELEISEPITTENFSREEILSAVSDVSYENVQGDVTNEQEPVTVNDEEVDNTKIH